MRKEFFDEFNLLRPFFPKLDDSVLRIAHACLSKKLWIKCNNYLAACDDKVAGGTGGVGDGLHVHE
jgi:hypothetical protein